MHRKRDDQKKRVPNEVNITNGKKIDVQYQSGAKLEVHHSQPNLLEYEESKGYDPQEKTSNLADLRQYLEGTMPSLDPTHDEAHRQTNGTI